MQEKKNWLTPNFEPQTCFDKDTNWWSQVQYCPVTCLQQFKGNKVITGSVDKVIKIWDIDSKKCPYTLFGHKGIIRCVKCSDEKIYSGGDDHTIRIWRMKDGRALTTIKAHKERVCCLQYNNGLIYSGSQDNTLCVWNENEKKIDKPATTLEGHSNPVFCLQFNNGILASGDADGKIKVWDIEKKKMQTIYRCAHQFRNCIARYRREHRRQCFTR